MYLLKNYIKQVRDNLREETQIILNIEQRLVDIIVFKKRK